MFVLPLLSAALEAPLFREIGASALPGVVTVCGSPRKDWILEVNGGGVLLGDFDGDGRCDLVIVDGSTLEAVRKGEPGRPPRTFLGKGDGTFAPAGEAWTLRGGRFGMAGTTGDWNRDGHLDLVITEWGTNRVVLNDGGKGWRELETGSLGPPAWNTSAAALDFDRDGNLDLAIVRYLEFDETKVNSREAGQCKWKGHQVMCGPEGLVATPDLLFRGKGDGTFEDVTAKSGTASAKPSFGLGAMTLDYDGDGDTDYLVANDSMANFLWENQGDGTFKDVAMRRGISHDANGKEQANMGIAIGDLNGDQREDVFITNFSAESDTLYLTTKNGGFRERAASAGLAGPSLAMLGWGTTLADFDLDGDLDLSVINGHVYPEADLPGTDTTYVQPAQLYRNDGSGRFTVEPLSSAGPWKGRASAAADLDGDGDLDLVALAVEGPPRVFLNEAPRGEGRHWLRVELRSAHGERFGLGARVTLDLGSTRIVREIRTSGGYQAAVPPEAHFGLGATTKVPRLVVRWPSGREQVLENVAVDRLLRIEEEKP